MLDGIEPPEESQMDWLSQLAHSGTDVLRRADAALYKAKRTGRNNVVVEKAA